MPAKKHKIALIEDDKMLSKYLSASLKSDGGFEVFAAMDGEAGEKLVREKKPDLVLLDIIMPKKNGFEVLISLKKDKTTKKIPIIMMSNLNQQKDIDQAKKLGAANFFVKVDMETSEIIDRVKKFLK
jgi:DNA-binding response OmpR family regulator